MWELVQKINRGSRSLARNPAVAIPPTVGGSHLRRSLKNTPFGRIDAPHPRITSMALLGAKVVLRDQSWMIAPMCFERSHWFRR